MQPCALARVAAFMAEVQPLRTLRYDAPAAGPLEDVIAPPYDVIDDELRDRARGAQPVQRRGDRPAARGRRSDPYEHAADHHGRVARARGAGARGRAGDLGPAPGLHGPRRPRPREDGLPRARARGGVRPGTHPAPRAHPPRAEGGSPPSHPRDAHEPLAHLQPVHGPRRAVRGTLEQLAAGEPFATATDHEGTRNTLWRISDPAAVGGLVDGARRRPSC